MNWTQKARWLRIVGFNGSLVTTLAVSIMWHFGIGYNKIIIVTWYVLLGLFAIPLILGIVLDMIVRSYARIGVTI
jgi:hypothetical protein